MIERIAIYYNSIISHFFNNFLFIFRRNSLVHRFKNQILSLVIETTGTQVTSTDLDTLMFRNILNMFTNLQCLNFAPYFHCNQWISFYSSPSPIFSSTLLELHIKVMYIEDCLYLLDCHFNQLRGFYVDIESSYYNGMLKINKVCFY